MDKIKNIEFLRIFLILTIVLFHMRVHLNKLGTEFFTNMYATIDGGRNCVEAFFIIAGFFLLLTYKNIPVFEFIKKKYFRLMPAAMFSIIICGIASIFHLSQFTFIPSMAMGLLFSHFGICWCKGSNIVLWYSSALFFGFIFFYLIIKYLKQKYHIPLFLILGIGSYILLAYLNHGKISGHSTMYYGIIPACTLRALGGMGIGCFIAKIYQKYKEKIANWNINIFQTILISLIELISLGFIIWWFYFKHITINNLLFLIFFSILFICFLAKKGWLSKLTDKNIWQSGSKYTYSVFTTHLPVIRIFSNGLLLPNKLLFSMFPLLTILLTLSVSIAIGIGTYYFVEKPCFNFLSKKYLKGINNA